MNVGEFIAWHRTKSGFKSQRQLAEKTDISSATISRIEKDIQKPNPDTLKELSKYLTSTSYGELMVTAEYWHENDEDTKLLTDIYEKKQQTTDKIIELIGLIVDDEGCFPAEYHHEIFDIFGGYAQFPDERKFDEWYLYDFLHDEDKTDKDIDGAIKEFNRYYNYKTVKYGMLNLDENFIMLKKTPDDFLEELETFLDKHDINAEKEFIKELELSDEELLKEYDLQLDGKKLTEDESKGIIAYLRSLRGIDK